MDTSQQEFDPKRMELTLRQTDAVANHLDSLYSTFGDILTKAGVYDNVEEE